MKVFALSILILGLAASGWAEAPVAIFAEPDFPYYIASPDVSPEFVRDCLAEAGIESQFINAAELGDPQAFQAGRFKVLAYVYGNTFPVAALANLRRFHAEGGSIVALGGVPFCHPCVQEEGRWVDKIEELGWEFVSHRQMGTGLWGEAADVEAVIHAPNDPLGLAWMPLPTPPGVMQFPRLGMTLEESRALGFDHLLGLSAEDVVIPVVSAVKGGVPVGHPVCIIEHRCAEFRGAVDVWAGGTWSPHLSLQQQQQLLVASCAYALERTGALTRTQRQEAMARVRERYVAPVTEAPSREGPFLLRANPPARRLVVFDAMGLNPDERLLALTLQGIVNRRQPRLYLLGEFQDLKWLKVLCQEGYETEPCDDLTALVDTFRKELTGAVVYDPAAPYTINLATMLAGVKGAAIATPELARQYGLPVVEDLRGRWGGAMEAYEWALETLWPHLDPRGVACMEPTWVAPRDYLVQFRLFTFWLDCQVSRSMPPDQALFLERLLAKMPPQGAVYGWWQQGDDGGIGEWRGVHLSSRYGKITVCTVGAYNLSVHAGLPLPNSLRQKPLRYGSLERKVYVTFLVSDGDNFSMNLYAVIERQWEQKMRGKVPVGWGICPTQMELTPAAVRYWYETASENDLFVAMDGLGYVYPDDYGFALGDPRFYYGEFLRQTGPYLRQLDLRHLWFLGGSSRAEQMARELPLEGLFGEYGVPAEQRQELFGATAALWADVNPWEKPWNDVASYVARIRERTPAVRPAFLFVGVNGFCIGPNEIAQILQALGPEYVAVRPDEFCHLFRQFHTLGVDPNPRPRPALDLTPPPLPGPYTRDDGTLVVREDDDGPDIGGWYTDPQGTQWVRKRLQVPLPKGATQATVYAFVRGEKGRRVTFRINGHEHTAWLETSSWAWATVQVPAAELRDGENEVWYTGNPEGRLQTAGDASADLDHSDYGGPDRWTSLSGELMCYLEVR